MQIARSFTPKESISVDAKPSVRAVAVRARARLQARSTCTCTCTCTLLRVAALRFASPFDSTRAFAFAWGCSQARLSAGVVSDAVPMNVQRPFFPGNEVVETIDRLPSSRDEVKLS